MFNNLIGSKTANRSKSFFSTLHQLAINSSLITNHSRKFSAEGFLLALIKSILSGKASFNQLADKLGKHVALSMSRQAMWKRVNTRAISFLLEALATSLQVNILDPCKKLTALSECFARILIEDSTTHRLHPSNADHSPGHGNGRSKTSLLKVDLIIDLLTGRTVQSALHQGTEQDREIGKDLVDQVKKRDLVLRDMGYFIITEFILIARKGAFWLSRVPANVILTTTSGTRIEHLLRSCQVQTWEGTVLLGKEEQHRCRLTAVRASPEVIRKNIAQAKERAKARGKELSKDQRERCHWHLIVTNLESRQLSVRELAELYRCRWNIEILFRA